MAMASTRVPPSTSSPTNPKRNSSVTLTLQDAPAELNKASSQVASKADSKIELKEEDCYDKLGFSFPTWKKWLILAVVFIVQVSMNFNASIYANAIDSLTDAFDIKRQTAVLGTTVFLVAYGFGSELWAPWSEELGRKPVLQASLLAVNLCQIPCALAKNFNLILAFRLLGGLASAGGSVTLGMVADLWGPKDQQYAVAFLVFSSVSGSLVGPIAGGHIQTHLSWQWIFWIQLILGFAVQFAHFWVPETRVTKLLDKEAKRQRKSSYVQVYGPGELEAEKTWKEVGAIWARPFVMFVKEPIVLFLSLLSGFSDALIFMFLESFGLVFKQWGFGPVETGHTFIA